MHSAERAQIAHPRPTPTPTPILQANQKAPANTFFSNLPEDLFSTIVGSFLSLEEAARLSEVNSIFYKLTVKSLESNRQGRIQNLTLLLNKSESNKSDISASNSINSALSEQELKLRESSSKQIISHLQLAEQKFTEDLLTLSETNIDSTLLFKLKNATLNGNPTENIAMIIREYRNCLKIDFKMLQEATLSPEPTLIIKKVIEKYCNSFECEMNVNLSDLDVLFILRSNSNVLLGIKEIMKNYGVRYLPLVMHLLKEIPDQTFSQTPPEDFKPMIDSLLKDNQLIKAVHSVKSLIAKYTSPRTNIEVIKVQFYALIIFNYLTKEDTSGILRALKVISKEINVFVFFPDIFKFLLRKNDYQTILDILNFAQTANLDSISLDLLDFSHLVEHVLNVEPNPIDQKIAKLIKFMRLFPQKGIKVSILEQIARQLLEEKVYIRDVAKEKIRVVVENFEKMPDILEERAHDLVRLRLWNEKYNGTDVSEIEGAEKIISSAKMLSNEERKRHASNYRMEMVLKRQAQDYLQFELLSSFFIELFIKKENLPKKTKSANSEPSPIFELFKEMTTTHKSKYAKELVQLYIKKNDCAGARQIAIQIPGEQGKKLNQEINSYFCYLARQAIGR